MPTPSAPQLGPGPGPELAPAPRTVAALFVQSRGCYADEPGVELWDERRDARTYPGPHPVVAHPPCARWSRLAPLVQSRWGHAIGDDEGCFEAALAAVRRWGRVIEHPAYSRAWVRFGLPTPQPFGWQRDLEGGWSCYVEQEAYGYRAKKATWLYAHGLEPFALRWTYTPDKPSAVLVSWCNNRTLDPDRPRLSRRLAAATPPAFRDELLRLARSVRAA